MTPAPISLDQVPAGWIADRRVVALREGHAIRTGAGRSIEVQSINTGRWHWLTLPTGAIEFTTTAERDTVLAQLQGIKS